MFELLIIVLCFISGYFTGATVEIKDHIKTMKEIQKITEECFEISHKVIDDLLSENTKIKTFLKDNYSIVVDEVGGIHDSGVGYNPIGEFCGECSKQSCQGCEGKGVI